MNDTTPDTVCPRCASAECYCSLIYSITIGIAVFDTSTGVLLDVNPAMEEITGYTRDELKLPEVQQRCMTAGDAALIRTVWASEGRAHHPNVAILRKDGTTRKVALYIDRGWFGDHRVALVVARDAAAQEKAEAALRESEEHFRGIFEDSPISLWVEDLSAVKTRLDRLRRRGIKDLRHYLTLHPREVRTCAGLIRVLDVNRATLDLYRAESKEQLIGDLAVVLAPESYQTLKEELVAISEGLLSFKAESVNRTLTGEPKHIDMRFSVAPGHESTYARVLVSIMDITAQKEAAWQLLHYQEQLRSLASQLSLAEQRERRRIASELHDSVGQNLALSKIKLGALRQILANNGAAEPLEEIRQLIDQSLQETRSLVFQLSPPVLYDLGLEQAVEWLVEQMEQRHGLSTSFYNDGKPKPLEEDVSTVLFQSVRELLLNVAKHAQASHAAVSMMVADGTIQLAVEDDGIGFEPGQVFSLAGGPKGFGLFNVRERLELLGGSLDIESSLERGTRAVIAAPLRGETRPSPARPEWG